MSSQPCSMAASSSYLSTCFSRQVFKERSPELPTAPRDAVPFFCRQCGRLSYAFLATARGLAEISHFLLPRLPSILHIHLVGNVVRLRPKQPTWYVENRASCDVHFFRFCRLNVFQHIRNLSTSCLTSQACTVQLANDKREGKSPSVHRRRSRPFCG